MTDQDLRVQLLGWLEATRGLCEEGALSASVVLEGRTEPITVTWTAGRGGRVTAAGRTLDVPAEALDEHGLVVA